MRKQTLTALLIAVGLVLGACSSADGTAATEPATGTTPSTIEVAVAGFQFGPDAIVIDAGDTVVWTNEDRIDHTVTAGTPDAPGDAFDLDLPDAGSTVSFTFDEPGTYEYFCAIHPHMRGTIEVRTAA